MTQDERDRCLRVLTAVYAAHNWRHYATKNGIQEYAGHLEVVARISLSTYDTDGLTRLVIAAHRERCRVSIAPHGFGWLRITVHPRQPDGDLYSRHPGMERLSEAATK